MKKFVTILCIAASLFSLSACGKKSSDADDYADRLVNGEVESNANIDENAATGGEVYTEADSDIELDIDVKALNELVDAANNEYKSFELVPIESADFFVNKNLHLVSFLKDHSMTFIYDSNITASFTDEALVINYPDSEGTAKTNANIIYKISAPMTTSEGNQYVYVAFGDHELTEDNKDCSIDCMMLIKMREDVDMQGYDADTYVLLIESAMSEQYELFRVE